MKLSRSKIELFLECPRCFWLDVVKHIKRPPGFPFTLNNAVDTLLKKEFDIHRAAKTTHPLMKQYGIKAVPLAHEFIDKWRANFTGISFDHKKSGIQFYGAIDDVWINKKGELHIVDYKATSTQEEITLEAEYRQGYKRQMEMYQWLFRHNGFAVSDTGYFVYCNGRKDKKAFDGKLEFDIQIIPYTGSDKWVEKALIDASKCTKAKTTPKSSPTCEYCSYSEARKKI